MGCSWGGTIDYSDARPSYFNLFTEPRTPRRMFENIGLESSWACKRMRGAAVEVDAIGEQQLKRTQAASVQQQLKRAQSGSAAGGRKRGAAVEAMQSGPGPREQQLIRSGRKRRAAAEADAIGEQQLCTESCPVPDYSR